MPVNLINEEELHQYLHDSIVGYEDSEKVSAEKLKSKEFVEKNREEIAEVIVYQWMKAKFRNFLTKTEKSDYLQPVKRLGRGMPTWVLKAQLRGEPVYRFNYKKVPFEKLQQLGRARMYLKVEADKYVNSQLNANQPKIRLDYLKTDHKIDSIEKVLILHNKMLSRVDFSYGTKDSMRFVNGYKLVKLTERKAFEAEANGMEHCLARDGYFDAYGKSDDFYSLRDSENKPHVTMQVHKGVVVQANGKGATAVNGRYHKYILAFIKANNLKVTETAAVDIGLIKVDKETLSIYDIPKNRNYKVENLDISDYHLTQIPDLHNVEVNNTFDVSNSVVENLKGCPQAKCLSIYDSNNFDEDFLKDLPASVEEIDGYGMPLKCFKYLPQFSSLKKVNLYGKQPDADELYDIPYHVLKKIKFEGVDEEFEGTYYDALRDGEDFSRFCSKYQTSMVYGGARA